MRNFENPLTLLKAILVRIPLVLKVIFLHSIRLSPVHGKQDLRTELTVAVIRSLLSFSSSISQQQKASMRDPGIKGPMWVSKVTFPPPEIDVQHAVVNAIEALKTGEETYNLPGVAPVEAEWTGYRSGVDKNAPQPDISEEVKYEALKQESKEDMVILYFHGGIYFLMDPCTHRPTVAQLSKRTGAPVLSVRYRLAPQHPFPAALTDALVAYLSLIAPPPGSLHDPVPARKIILAGDSAGGNLALVLCQLLLTLRRTQPTLRFHGRDLHSIDLLPAGVATSSPWCDMTRSMPSVAHNAIYDYLDAPTSTPATEPYFRPLVVPADDIWPVKPPRVDLYTHASALLHPLVSPIASTPALWTEAPPIFMSIGEEGLTDEALVLARTIHRAGAPIYVEQFEGMPHCFGLVMLDAPAGRRFYDGMARFCRQAVDVAAADRAADKPALPDQTRSGEITYIGYKLLSEKTIPLEEAVPLTDEEIEERLRVNALWRQEGERELQREWAEKAQL
ncbi:putative lipase/esterase [Aspergillus saccharolyticus JOP 1030-1]|uniref:Putative lipase/esterase n=1 Tax=Aspergillus saccharolyticus JOP 1030-1 TaxID=1450539 RepID=A0A318ZE15_9EURO|nr:putative lipase/esterase [Aspergillus saccharolyticus JOP 1030-1]PYH45435.1 putative lipase/esterase [Aspergillus saccharolyticus JOP 1030-1]